MGFLARSKYRLRCWLARRPRLFFAVFSCLPRHRHLLLRRDTQLVIEGYPRSANTFSVVAFTKAQPGPIRLAHHLHAQAQVLRAVELGIPACVLIRRPADAVKSFLVMYPDLLAVMVLQAYIEFYSDILHVADRVVIAKFEDVTADCAKMMDALNRKFGTSFRVAAHTGDFEASVFAEVRNINAEYERGRKEALAMPSSYKNVRKSEKLAGGGAEELLARAEEIYTACCHLAK